MLTLFLVINVKNILNMAASVFIVSILLLSAIPMTSAATADIWLQTPNSGGQVWASVFSGGVSNPTTIYGGANNGTSVLPCGPSNIVNRKIIVHNHGDTRDLITFTVQGLPVGWTYTVSPPVWCNPNIAPWTGHGTGTATTHQGYGSLTIKIPDSTKDGNYPYTIVATSLNGARSTLPDSINIKIWPPVTPAGNWTPTPKPTPTPMPTPTPSVTPTLIVTPTVEPRPSPTATITPRPSSSVHPSPSPSTKPSPSPSATPTSSPTIVPSGNLIVDPSFEQGFDISRWVGTGQSNYKDNMVLSLPGPAHSGTRSLTSNPNKPTLYARSAYSIPYGGHGFDFNAWFYANLSEPVNLNDTLPGRGTSVWAGVTDIPVERTLEGRARLDDITRYRVVGYNNRSNYKNLSYHQGMHYDGIVPIRTSGWYEGRIHYDGNIFTYSMYNSSGGFLGSKTWLPDPGFVPRSIIVNAGSTHHRIDDLSYRTW